jgi:catechol 2,3-dioxygenase-like lactoylglutathione lyase family enzyme
MSIPGLHHVTAIAGDPQANVNFYAGVLGLRLVKRTVKILTDPPGFTADEPAENLGASLKLPPWLEPIRAQIEQNLQPIQLP